ncbi:MAG TPA: mandelate racemase/muconate lactonizing enzyme family protein [Spirochaetia bacterium]|nr:mandelate racemase/muconate lactonizing enzyme family protein [Spirochaetia bacterium]
MRKGLKIEGFVFHEVVVPARPGTINSEGMDKPLHKLSVNGRPGWSVQFDEVPKLLFEMRLESGTIGLGEFYRGHDWAVVESIARFLIGKSLSDFPLQALPIAWCREYDGFECAIWDAYAKELDVRVVDLLGGPVQERVAVGAWSGHRHIEEIGDLVTGFRSQGYDCVKFKCDLDDDVVGWCQEIAKAAPGMRVILDPNERWENSGETRRRIEGLAKVGNVLCLEDPIPRWMLQDMAQLRQYSPIPIVLHVSLPYVVHGQRPHDAVNALAHHAVDGFNFNCGLANFQRLDHIASTANLSCWHGSELDLGVLEAMYLHSCAAAQSCRWPSDIFGRLVRSHDLLSKPLTIEPPWARLPEGPGLGVELDAKAVRSHQSRELEIK